MSEAHGQALLTCDSVAHDPSTGKITLYGVFDRVSSLTFPAMHPLLAIYWKCLVRGPGRVGVSILRPDGSTLADLEPVEHAKEGEHSLQGTYTIGGLELPAEGRYVLSLRYNNKEVLTSALHLIRREPK